MKLISKYRFEKGLSLRCFLVQLKPILSKPGLKKKGREKGRSLNWNTVQYIAFGKKKKRLKSAFFFLYWFVLNPPIHFCKHNVFDEVLVSISSIEDGLECYVCFRSKVQAFTRFFVFKCNIYAHGISLLLFSCCSFSDFTSFVVSFKWYTVRTWVISSSFVKVYRWSCYFVVCTTFCFSSLLKCDVQVLPFWILL